MAPIGFLRVISYPLAFNSEGESISNSSFMTYFQNFTSLYLSMESRDDLTEWQELFTKSLGRPASFIREDVDGQDIGACAGT